MKKFASFEQFWPFYVGEHRKKLTRMLHFAGTLLALTLLVLSAFLGAALLIAVPFAGYGFAWGSHAFVERNRPATFTYPLWSLLADLKMFGLMAGGKMDLEVKRLEVERLESEPRSREQPDL